MVSVKGMVWLILCSFQTYLAGGEASVRSPARVLPLNIGGVGGGGGLFAVSSMYVCLWNTKIPTHH